MYVRDLRIGILYYIVSTDGISVIVAGGAQEKRLYPVWAFQEFFPLADQLFDVVQRSNQESRECVASFARGWGPKLLPPRAAFAEFDLLVIVPHYWLHGIPFHAIAVDDGYLGTAHALTYGSSATLLTRSASRNRCRQVDLSGWQYFTDGTAAIDAPPQPFHSISFGIDAIGEKTSEYAKLAQLFARYFVDEGSLVQPAYPRYSLKYPRWSSTWDVICMVCHGYFDLLNLDNSGLIVSTDSSGIPDMNIVLHRDASHSGNVYRFADFPFITFPMESSLRENEEPEVMATAELKVGQPTNAELVALIGCHTGAGQLQAGGDFASLAYQWLKFGAASVLASGWQLDLAFANRWLPLFLENWLERRQPKAVAVQQALTRLFAEEPTMIDSVHTWAALSLLGDWL
jgi:CHAT domain-containing protein